MNRNKRGIWFCISDSRWEFKLESPQVFLIFRFLTFTVLVYRLIILLYYSISFYDQSLSWDVKNNQESKLYRLVEKRVSSILLLSLQRKLTTYDFRCKKTEDGGN